MRIAVLFLTALLCSTISLAADSPAKQEPPPNADNGDKVPPAKYRILVKYDNYTNDAIRKEIRDEVEKAIEQRRRRLGLSQEELHAQLRRELGKHEAQLKAIAKAGDEEQAARKRGDLTEAERWRNLRLERTREALELAKRTRMIEDAMLALSLENWQTAKEKEHAIAEKALKRLEAMLKELQTPPAPEPAPAPAPEPAPAPAPEPAPHKK